MMLLTLCFRTCICAANRLLVCMQSCCQSCTSAHASLLPILFFSASSTTVHSPLLQQLCWPSPFYSATLPCLTHAPFHSSLCRICPAILCSPDLVPPLVCLPFPLFSCMRAAVHGIGALIRCGCCRGRAERMAFADSFVQAYHFRLLYLSSAMMYPIMGAMRHSYGKPWQVNKFPFVIACKCVKWSSALSRDVLETGGYCS